jgi:tRNA(Ile)-lysidine synthase
VLVACSGGADSVALLGLLACLRRSLDLRLSVGHVDHRLRPGSGEDARLVEELAAGLGLACAVERLDLLPGPGLPARARAARRAALERQAARVGASWIALGHTATDQTETVLMHLARGCGLDGLSGMPAFDPPWLRPLLHLVREDTRGLAAALQLRFVDDPTNLDPDHARVRLRLSVLPYLRGENPRADRAVVEAAEQARDADEALLSWARRECAARRRGEHQWALGGLHEVPRAVRTRALRLMCEEAGVDLGALRYRVIDAIDRTVVAQALSREAPERGPGVAPRSWDLHPARRLSVGKDGISVEPTREPNH